MTEDLKRACKNIEKQLKAIEKEYRKKNIIHRLREDWGYAFYSGKLVAYKYILERLGNR